MWVWTRKKGSIFFYLCYYLLNLRGYSRSVTSLKGLFFKNPLFDNFIKEIEEIANNPSKIMTQYAVQGYNIKSIISNPY